MKKIRNFKSFVIFYSNELQNLYLKNGSKIMETIPIPKNFKDLINQMKNLGNIKIK